MGEDPLVTEFLASDLADSNVNCGELTTTFFLSDYSAPPVDLITLYATDTGFAMAVGLTYNVQYALTKTYNIFYAVWYKDQLTEGNYFVI